MWISNLFFICFSPACHPPHTPPWSLSLFSSPLLPPLRLIFLITRPALRPLFFLIIFDFILTPVNVSVSTGIGTEDGSAKVDEDYKGKSQRQVQFNPGQTRATWRVRILTDGKYEQAETFQILLSEPVMGVMEFPSTATVEILDPSDGQYCINYFRLHYAVMEFNWVCLLKYKYNCDALVLYLSVSIFCHFWTFRIKKHWPDSLTVTLCCVWPLGTS